MKRDDCPKFDYCNVPLCPKDEESMQHCAWFPDEDICPLRFVPEWIKRQRRIAKATNRSFEAGCFTVRMLKRRCRITQGIKGADPDKGPPEEQEQDWLNAHPVLVPTKAQKAQTRSLRNELRGT